MQPTGAACAQIDRVEELGDRIATLAAHLHAATHQLLVLLAEFDRLRGWEQAGHRDCADWLSARTGIDRGAAQEKVRAARALTRMPRTSEAMARGELSFSKVRALTRLPGPEDEPLTELAKGVTTAQLERMVRAYKKGIRRDEAERERELHEERTLSVFPDDEGMYVIRGRVPAEVGALIRRALEAASEALFRENPVPGEGDEERRRKSAQRRADALGLVAERAIAAGFVGSEPEQAAESPAAKPRAAKPPVSGGRADRFQVVLHVDAPTLSADQEPGRSELEDGTRLSAESARRISCDVGLVQMTHAPDGSVLSVGRRARTIPPRLRRALEVRDRGCRFPGCALLFTDAHHVRHWADGGETSVDNCLLLCRHHHRLVHEGGWRIVWWGRGRPLFIDPHGHEHFDGSWKPPRLDSGAVRDLVEKNLAAGIAPGPWTASARWLREREIPDELYFESLSAL